MSHNAIGQLEETCQRAGAVPSSEARNAGPGKQCHAGAKYSSLPKLGRRSGRRQSRRASLDGCSRWRSRIASGICSRPVRVRSDNSLFSHLLLVTLSQHPSLPAHRSHRQTGRQRENSEHLQRKRHQSRCTGKPVLVLAGGPSHRHFQAIRPQGTRVASEGEQRQWRWSGQSRVLTLAAPSKHPSLSLSVQWTAPFSHKDPITSTTHAQSLQTHSVASPVYSHCTRHSRLLPQQQVKDQGSRDKCAYKQKMKDENE